jgi:neutral amino acid transport system permease protein
VLLVALGVLVAAGAGTAHAEEQELTVRVQNIPEDGGKKQPVAGVDFVVTGPDGAEVASGVTDDKGVAKVKVPSDGEFTVTIDTSTLPEGLGIPDDEASRTVNVTAGLGGNANFNLGAAGPVEPSKAELLPKAIVNGVRFGLVIAIMSVGLSLIYGTTGLSNFAHGETVTLGAVMTWTFADWIKVSNSTTGFGALVQISFAATLGIAAAMLFSGGLEKFVWKPMRGKGIGLTSMMIVSIGIAIAARFIIQWRYGAQPKSYAQFGSQENINFDFGPIEFGVTPRDLTTAGIALAALLGVAFLLMRTRTGKAIRAVADNPDLSSTTGINTDRIIMFVWLLGGALAGLGGVIFGLDEQVQWNMGTRLLLLMFAAITLGGLGRPFGALVGSLVVGLFVQLWAWWFSDFTDLKNIGALAAMILVLLFRPQGILGKKERIG